jgi:hypothetical protein
MENISPFIDTNQTSQPPPEGPFLIPIEVGKRYDYDEFVAIVQENEASLRAYGQIAGKQDTNPTA